jgi:hypothetical protein
MVPYVNNITEEEPLGSMSECPSAAGMPEVC